MTELELQKHNAIETIYKEVGAIMLTHIMINDEAMASMQMLGLQGFKRLHRFNYTILTSMYPYLRCSFKDNYGSRLSVDVSGINYDPQKLEDHLTAWDNKLKATIVELGILNKRMFDATGKTSGRIEKLIKIKKKHKEKTHRWLYDFELVAYNRTHVKMVDDALHTKYKDKENSIIEALEHALDC